MGQWFPPIKFLGRTLPSYFQPILAAISVTHSNDKSQTNTRLYTGAIDQIKQYGEFCEKQLLFLASYEEGEQSIPLMHVAL